MALPATSMPTSPLPEATGGDSEDLAKRLEGFIATLHSEAQRRVYRRNTVEQRWIEDLQQYHGVYTDDTLARLNKNKGSRAFINLTATKTDSMTARLIDLLFPTDDRNWGIEPTPVPELTEQAEVELGKADKASEAGDRYEQEALQAKDQNDEQAMLAAEEQMRQAEQAENMARLAAHRLQKQIEEARRRANLMQEEIEDQLVTCNYQAEARDVIADACKMGLGVMKGPVIGHRPKRRWSTVDEGGPDRAAVYQLEVVEDKTPALVRVDPWSFFPDPDVRRIEDSEGFYERHLMNHQQLRKLAQRSDMDKDALRDLLRIGPQGGETPPFLTDLHNIGGQTDGRDKEQFVVWEYTGPIEIEQLEIILASMDDEEGIADLDVLEEHHVRIWFCQGRMLSFAPYHLDSGDPLYSCFTIRPDEASLFGYGIPYIMRHPQAILNGAFRMMMDNAGLGTGPQIVVNKDVVEPQDGDWTLKPRKIWRRNSAQTAPGVPAFEAFNIPSNQKDLADIIQIARATIDEVTSMPAIAEGEQGTGVTKTAQGMALLMNSANVGFRRIVRSYDDDMTVPCLKRLYDYNMQFSEKEEIKGDYEVKARGSGVLLVREMQAQNLLMIAQMFGDHPTYGSMLKHGNLLRQIFRAHMIPADEITKTDREHKQFLEEQANQPDPEAEARAAEMELKKAEIDVRRMEAEAKVEIANMDADTKRLIAQMGYDEAMVTLAEKMNIDVEKLRAMLADNQAKRDSDERKLAVEVAMREKTGESAGGSV